MIQWLAAGARGLQEDGHLLTHHLLADIFIQRPGPNGPVDHVFPRALRRRRYQAIGLTIMHCDPHPFTVAFRARRIRSSLLVTVSSLTAPTIRLASCGL